MADEFTQEEFDPMFDALVYEMCVDEILSVPGVRELLVEHLNNEVLKQLEDDKLNDKNEEEDGAEGDDNEDEEEEQS